MTYDDFIHTLKQLPTSTTYPYLPSSTSSEEKSYKLISVNDDSIRVERDGDVISISIQQIQTLLQALRKDIPLDVEKTLGSSGNTRSIIEALLCLTPTIFYTRIVTVN